MNLSNDLGKFESNNMRKKLRNLRKKKWFVGAVSFAALLLVSPAAQAASKKKAAGKDPYGINKLLKQLSGKQKLSPNKQVQLEVVLKPRDQNQMADQIYAVNTPGNQDFKHFYNPASFRAKFGQNAEVVGQYRPYFKKYHLKTHNYSNGLMIKVSGKAKNVNKAFNTNLQTAKYRDNPVQFSSKKPKMPAKLADNVLTVLGITSFNSKMGGGLTQTGAQAASAKSSKNKANKKTKVQTKVAKKKQTKPEKQFAPQKFVNRYHLQSLYDKGYYGQGQTLGVVTFGGFSKRDAQHYWKGEHIATKPNRISVKKLSAPSPFGAAAEKSYGLETTLDVQQSGAIAPQANIRVYQSKFSDVGMVDAFTTAFDENRVSSLSLSYGLSEYIMRYLKNQGLINPVYGQVMNIVMAQGAMQGISTFVASGDTGAYNIGIGGKILNAIQLPNYSIYGTFPADNPWVTTTGGTTLPFHKNYGHGLKFSVDKERAWGGDYMFKAFAKHRNVFLSNLTLYSQLLNGGGGGISHVYGTPQYQQGVSGVNTFNAREFISNALQPRMNPVLLSGTDYGRNFPDVSANADPMTGYQIYMKKTGWVSNIGGTSSVAPQFSGATAVINSGKGGRMGFWNPQIYKLAQDKDKTPFTTLDSATDNSNLYYTGQPGKIYNQATGLGTVDFEKLYNNFQ